MAYSRTTWANGTSPYLSATNLNNIEAGVVAALANACNVVDHGAVGDSSTDDTTAIQAAADAAAAKSGVGLLVFPSGYSGFKTTDTIDIASDVAVWMGSRLYYAGTQDKAAIEVTGSAAQKGLWYRFWIEGSASPTWSSESHIGVKMTHVQFATIDVAAVRNFTIGFQLAATSSGSCYNVGRLGMVSNCKVGVEFKATSTGWVNENTFTGGAFTVDSDVNLSTTRYGIRLVGGSNLANSNVFYRPSFEIDASITGGAEAICVYLSDAIWNRVVDMRDESYEGALVRTTGTQTDQNFVSTTYSSAIFPVVDDQGAKKGTIVRSMRAQEFVESHRLVYAVEDMHKRACFYESGWVSVPGLQGGNSTNTTPERRVNATVNTDYLEFAGSTRDIGFWVDCREIKTFTLDCDCESGYGGRTLIRCFDSSMVLIDPASSGTNLLDGIGGSGFQEITDSGGSYITSADSNYPTTWKFTSTVKFAWIAKVKGTNNLRIRSMRLTTPEYRAPSAWCVYPDIYPMATAAPTEGAHPQGRIVWNVAPTAGQPRGWVCTVAGTPGTWLSLGNL